MCGLVGIAGNLGLDDEKFFKRQLILDYFRGTDSTGAAIVETDETTHLIKKAVNPIDLFDDKRFDKALNGWYSKVFLGHNRAATLGVVNNTNAHPFEYGDTIGAHNGTLDKESWKRLEQACGFETNVDSAAIFAAINEIGIHDTINLLEKGRTASTGAWALTIYDGNTGDLQFIRNEHRPLWYAFNKECDKIIWASEWPMINAAANLTKGWGELYVDDDGYSFWPFKEDTLYSINVDKLISGIEPEAFRERCEPLKGRDPAPVSTITYKPQQQNGGANPFVKKEEKKGSSQTTSSNTSSNTTKKTESKALDTNRIKTVTQVDFNAAKPLGNFLTTEEFNDIAKYGCSHCGTDVSIDDPNIVVFKQERAVLCPDCHSYSDGNTRVFIN